MRINSISSSSFRGWGDIFSSLGQRYLEGDPDYQLEQIRKEDEALAAQRMAEELERRDDFCDTFERAANQTEDILVKLANYPGMKEDVSILRKNLAVIRADRLNPGKLDEGA